MSEVIDIMLKPILKIHPFFTFPPVTSVICGIVSIIKGGAIEKIPGIGDMVSYAREFIMIGLMVFLVSFKVMQFIGPKLWHFFEKTAKMKPDCCPKPAPPERVEGDDDDDDDDDDGFLTGIFSYGLPGIISSVVGGVKKFDSVEKAWTYFIDWLLWAPFGLHNWAVTVFLQIPVDILSWDMESLSLDFGHEWGTKSNAFRGDCRRFINGSYAGDFSLYEDETIEDYYRDTHENSVNDIYASSASGTYLCTHGSYCGEISDVFGLTLLGMNASDTGDNSPTNGYINGINISSAPRKYDVCCSYGNPAIKGRPGFVHYPEEHCKEKYPDIDLPGPDHFENLHWDEIKDIVQNPRVFISKSLEALDKHKYPEDHHAAYCHLHNWFYDSWSTMCSGPWNPIPCPDHGRPFLFYKKGIDTSGEFAHRAPGSEKAEARQCESRPDGTATGDLNDPQQCNGCSKTLHEISEDMVNNIVKSRDECVKTANAQNDHIINLMGCNNLNMDQAERSVLRNRNDVLDAQLKRKRGEGANQYDSIYNEKNQYIKRTEWKKDEKLPEAPGEPPTADELKLSQTRIADLKIKKSGTPCDKHDLSEMQLEECFGPFKPMISKQYPILFKNIIKEFMGKILWFLIIVFIIFIILYILCLFNRIGRAAYYGNKNPESLGGLLKSMGLDNLNN